jgi:putative oxidoreductase
MQSPSYAALLLRLALGTMWLSHALLKIFVFTLPGTALFFEGAGLAGWMAYPVVIFEIVGGAALLLGVYARQAAVALLPIMLVATLVHAPNGWLFTASGGGWEYPAFLSIASIVQWLLGDGRATLVRSTFFSPEASY